MVCGAGCMRRPRETRDLPDILEHDEQRPIVDIIHTLNDSTGLRRDSRIISEPGLYSLVLRSRKPEAKAFKRWIVHEVIPPIRRTGGYGAPALPNFRNPAEAARAWADKEEQRLLEEQKRLALEQRMEEVKPKVVFAESIEVAQTSISVGEMAKLIKQATGYDIGQNRFFEWHRNRATCTRMALRPTCLSRETWMPDGWRARKTPSSESAWSHEHPLPPPYSFT